MCTFPLLIVADLFLTPSKYVMIAVSACHHQAETHVD